MVARGPALSFDPQYVDFVISVWHAHDFAPMAVDDLQRLALVHAEHVFTHLNVIGLAPQQAKPSTAKAAITLIKALKLAKQTSSGTRSARVVKMSPTPLGREILPEEPQAGAIRVGLVGHLVKSSPPLSALLSTLEERGPLSRPIAHPLPGTPTKGVAFNRGVLEGLAQYYEQEGRSTELAGRTSARRSPTQELKAAALQETQRHPASAMPSFEKGIALAAELGLLWRDIEPINQSLGIESIGSAATSYGGTMIPYVPTWQGAAAHFQDTLWRVYRQRVDSSGLMTIATLRGGIGRELGISAAVVDTFLRLTREAGERGECSLTLQFEPNDDMLYAAGRRPLIWQDTAFDFVEVQRTQATPSTGGNSSTHRDSGMPPTS